MKKFMEPSLVISEFDVQDVITSSNGIELPDIAIPE